MVRYWNLAAAATRDYGHVAPSPPEVQPTIIGSASVASGKLPATQGTQSSSAAGVSPGEESKEMRGGAGQVPTDPQPGGDAGCMAGGWGWGWAEGGEDVSAARNPTWVSPTGGHAWYPSLLSEAEKTAAIEVSCSLLLAVEIFSVYHVKIERLEAYGRQRLTRVQ